MAIVSALAMGQRSGAVRGARAQEGRSPPRLPTRSGRPRMLPAWAGAAAMQAAGAYWSGLRPRCCPRRCAAHRREGRGPD